MVKQAAVLVALFQKPGDDGLSVLLTTRAKTLRWVLAGTLELISSDGIRIRQWVPVLEPLENR